MTYDPVSVHSVTGDSDGTSNGIVAKHGRIKVHKVVLQSDGSNAVSVALNDHGTIGSSAVIVGLANNQSTEGTPDSYVRLTQSDFDPPVPFEVGLSIDVTGNGATVRVYYTA